MRFHYHFSVFFIFTYLATVANSQFANPLMSSPSPDPFVLHHEEDGFYYMTLSDSHREISILKNPILSDWRGAERKVIYEAPVGLDNLFAPEIHWIRNAWYIYFTIDDGIDANHRIHILRSESNDPFGNYSAATRVVFAEEDYFAIDATPLLTDDGNLYMIYSGWPEPDLGGNPYGANLYIVPMSNPTIPSGPRVLLREPKYLWEGTTVEGPQILRTSLTPNRTFLLYSAASTWDDTYVMSSLYLDSPDDPLVPENWKELSSEPMLYKNDEANVYGPGHGSVTTSKDGTEAWLVYHAMDELYLDNPEAAGRNRTARAQRLLFNLDGSPVFPRPVGLTVPLELPSGEIN